MEIRTLEYFLAVAREENMTEAANTLHITQPTLSRQIADLEQELGKQLFIRTNRNTKLTEDGIHLRQRAEEILSLVRQTEAEISDDQTDLTGCIRLGAGETRIAHFLTDAFTDLHLQHPQVTCNLFTGNADIVEEKLSHGLIDFGLFIDPFDASGFESIALPEIDQVGIITKSDSPWSHYKTITPDIIADMPLLVSSRRTTHSFDFESWSGGTLKQEDLNIVGSFDLIGNASLLIKGGLTNAMAMSGLYQQQEKDITYVPLEPARYLSCVVAWKKYQLLSRASEAFLKCLKKQVDEYKKANP